MENLQFLKEAWQALEAPRELDLSHIKAKSMATVKKTNSSLKIAVFAIACTIVVLIGIFLFLPFPSLAPKIFLGLTSLLLISFAFIFDYNRKKNERLDPSLSPIDYIEEMKGFVKRKKMTTALTMGVYLPLLIAFMLNYTLTLGMISLPPLALGILIASFLVMAMIIVTTSIIAYNKTFSHMNELKEELRVGEDDLAKGLG